MDDITVYDWDSQDVEVKSVESVLLEEGTYPFTVLSLEREYFEGSAKMPACPRANVKLRIDGRSTISDRIMLTSKWMWRAKRLFEAIGMADPDIETFTPNWGAIEGREGFLRVKVREYERNGETRKCNDVDFYYAASDSAKAIETYQREAMVRDAATGAFQQPAQQPQQYQPQYQPMPQQYQPQYQPMPQQYQAPQFQPVQQQYSL